MFKTIKKKNITIFDDNFFILDNSERLEAVSEFFGYHYNDNEFDLRGNPGKLIDEKDNGLFVNIQTIDGSIIIQQDYHRSFGIFIYRNEGYWAVSNSLFLLANHLRNGHHLRLDEDFIAMYWLGMVACSNTGSPICGISELDQGEFLAIECRDGNLNIIRHPLIKEAVNPFTRDGLKLLDDWHMRFSKILRTLTSQQYSISADLSGGFDSRAAFTVLCKPDIFQNINIFSVKDDIQLHQEDYEIATNISKIYNFPISSPKQMGKRILPEKSILNTLACKIACHNQFFFKDAFHDRPVFNINGNGGEGRRNCWGMSIESFFKSIESDNNKMEYYSFFEKRGRACIESNLDEVLRTHPEKLHPMLKFYIYTRIKHHFARTMVESFQANMISLSPLMDPALYQLDLGAAPNGDYMALFALIYNRYAPEMDNVKFDHGKTIKQETLDYVRKINSDCPCKQSRQPNSAYTINIRTSDVSYAYNGKNTLSPANLFISLFRTDKVRKFVTERYSEAFYKSSLKQYNPNIYCGFPNITRLLSEYLLVELTRNKQMTLERLLEPGYEGIEKIMTNYGILRILLTVRPLGTKNGSDVTESTEIVEKTVFDNNFSRVIHLPANSIFRIRLEMAQIPANYESSLNPALTIDAFTAKKYGLIVYAIEEPICLENDKNGVDFSFAVKKWTPLEINIHWFAMRQFFMDQLNSFIGDLSHFYKSLNSNRTAADQESNLYNH